MPSLPRILRRSIFAVPLAFLLSVQSAISAAERVEPQTTEVSPVRFEKRGNVLFADFGKDVYGNLRIEFASAPPAEIVQIRLGEKLTDDGTIDRKPPGSVKYCEVSLTVEPNQLRYQLDIPSTKYHLKGKSVIMPVDIGEVTPFRYAEIEGAALPLEAPGLHQLFIHAPFNDQASSFESSDATLNAVWALCKHTMKATSAFGVYIDGERERTPYEADAYIAMLSHYACDLDPRVAHYSIEYLLKHPTWPTEWNFHMPMMAAADYMATGDSQLAADNYDALKKKLLMDKARADGLLSSSAIVDWPGGERDDYNNGVGSTIAKRQAGPEINTVTNAFYYHALRQMAMLAAMLHKDADAHDLDAKATQVYQSFNQVFFDPARGIYIDGEGSTHASLHANMLPLAFDLVPPDRVKKVADFAESRGMACSVYGAQYLLEAMFDAGRDDYAIGLMTAKTKRSWWNMIALGSTMTLEAWDAEYKKNLTWNHAWGAAPANIISRFVLGVRPIKPGYSELLIAPQLGSLKWARGRVPTPLGAVIVNVSNDDIFKLEITIPAGAKARIDVPRRTDQKVMLDGKPITATTEGTVLHMDFVESGKYVIESL